MNNRDDKINTAWTPSQVDVKKIKTGDMPGDKIQITDSHFIRANTIFPYLLEDLKSLKGQRFVISVYGGSGVGKSEIGSILGHYCELAGFGAYVLSGDNYPLRIPEENDRERQRVFRRGGREALKDYLGGLQEIDFAQINQILDFFKRGALSIGLKRMGRTTDDISHELVDFSKVSILIIEWTHGNNPLLKGVDFPIFLYSTPEQTMAHRISRGRDKGIDSPFVKTVLDIEQEKLSSQAESSRLIVGKDGEILSSIEFLKLEKK